MGDSKKATLEVLDQRVENVEGAIEAFREFAKEFTRFSERIVKLEEHRDSSSGMVTRAFTRLEAVERAVVGDGTNQNPGLFTGQREIRGDIESIKTELGKNTFWTRLVFGTIVIAVLGWAGNALLKADGRTPVEPPRIEVPR